MDYDTHHTTNPYLDKVRSHTESYLAKVLGKDIVVYPNVMSPKYDWSSRFHIENMPDQKGKRFLEVGCGCGVISLFAGLQGATEVRAIDINPDAVENTRANFEEYGLPHAEALISDVFEKVTGKFDTIFFPAPYHGNKPADMLERGVSDEDYNALRRVMNESAQYLNIGGQLLVGFSDTGDLGLLESLIKSNSYRVVDLKKEVNEGWEARLYILEVGK